MKWIEFKLLLYGRILNFAKGIASRYDKLLVMYMFGINSEKELRERNQKFLTKIEMYTNLTRNFLNNINQPSNSSIVNSIKSEFAKPVIPPNAVVANKQSIGISGIGTFQGGYQRKKKPFYKNRYNKNRKNKFNKNNQSQGQ